MAESEETLPEKRLGLLIALAGFFSLRAVFEALLIGIGFGTIVDLQMAPDFLWPPESSIVTNALLPMFVVAVGMIALALGDFMITMQLNEHVAHRVRLDLRPSVRRFLARLLRLGRYAFLICACAAIALWTHVYFWHGHIWAWLFSIATVFLANAVAISAKALFLMDAQRLRPAEETAMGVKEKFLMASLAIVVAWSIASHFMHRGG